MSLPRASICSASSSAIRFIACRPSLARLLRRWCCASESSASPAGSASRLSPGRPARGRDDVPWSASPPGSVARRRSVRGAPRGEPRGSAGLPIRSGACSAETPRGRTRSDSSSVDSAFPRTRGISRTVASIKAIAAISPPVRTKSPSADLLDAARLEHPLVDPLEPAAEQRDPGPRASARARRLVEAAAARREVDHRPSSGPAGCGGVERRGGDVGPQHHARAAARRACRRRCGGGRCATSRISCGISSRQSPASSARPVSEWPSGPGNISGKA